MGSTSKRGLRYPESTVLANTLHTRIKELAEDTELQLDYTAMAGGFQRYDNLAMYQEATANLPGYIVIQTNLTYLNTMTRLHIQGMTYENNNNIIDLLINFYPYSSASAVGNVDATNNGTHSFKSIGIYHRNSDSKIAVVLETWSPTTFWQYPKLVVDGMFAHTAVDPATVLASGWSISRQTSLAAYTSRATLNYGRWAKGDDTGWIALPTQNSWSAYSPSFPARYKREGGWVTVEGLIAKSIAVTGGDIFATLPPGFRSFTQQIFLCAVLTSPYACQIYSPTPATGEMRIQAGANATWTSLSGIHFQAEQ